MMMTMTMTTTTLVRRVMTSVLEPVIMYALFSTFLPHVTPFQYSWFHIIFVLGAMYVAMLLTDWYENIRRFSVSTLILYKSYSGMSSVRARRHLQPMAMTSTSGALRQRCGCVSSVRGSACFFIYGVCSLRSSCPTGKFAALPLIMTYLISEVDSLIYES
jgi:hypothetical protein